MDSGCYRTARTSYAPHFFGNPFGVRNYVERQRRHYGIKCSVRIPNVVGVSQFKAGVSTRALGSSEVQVRLRGVESNGGGTEIRSRGGYHASPTAYIEDSLTPTDTGKFQKRPRQTAGSAAHKHFVSRGVVGHKGDHFILPIRCTNGMSARENTG